MNLKYLFLTLFLSLFLTACGSSSSDSDPTSNEETPNTDNDSDDSGDDSSGDDTDDGTDDGADDGTDSGTDDGTGDDGTGDDTAGGDDTATESPLVAHFSFEDNLTEATGNFAAGQVTGTAPDTEGGSVTYSAGALEGSSAVALDGTSGVDLGQGLIGPGDYTISLWLNPDELAQFTPAFFGIHTPDSWVSLVPAGPGDAQHTMLWAGSDLGTGWFDGTLGEQIAAGAWSHLVFTYSGGTLTGYLNGELAMAHEGFPDVFTTAGGNFYLGVNPFPNDAPYTGLVDELRIYDVALTAEQVASLAVGEEPQFGDAPAAEPTIADITGISAHYAFEDGLTDTTANFTEGSVVGERPDATDAGTVTYEAAGVAGGKALVLDGASGVRMPNGLISGTAWTLSLWVKPTALTDWQSVVFSERAPNEWFTLMPRSGIDGVGAVGARVHWAGNEREWWDVITNIPEPTGLTVGEWAHLTLTLDGTELRMYIDGTLRGSASDFNPFFESTTDALVTLGVNWWDAPYSGSIDQLRVYNRALTQEEVTLLSGEND